ncbi:MAG TPA: exodeoxyribonuclease V subunit alpha [Candidatus Binataceae bacterium]|nr:exodeoxyribonuclease V subunit alpha [Candidatus Binataceae bacterium]
MDAVTSKYARLGLAGGWRGFEIAGGGKTTAFEGRLRELEKTVIDLNLEREAVHLAAELAALQPELDDEARLALIVLIVITLAALTQGSTRFPVAGEAAQEPMSRMMTALLGANHAERERLRTAIDTLLKNDAAPAVIGRSDRDRRPLLFLDSFIYHERSLRLETRLAGDIAALLQRPRPFDEARIGAAVADVAKRPAMAGKEPIALSDEQLRAIRTAVTSRLALISGGPGTGKTSIVVAILRVLKRLGVTPGEISLAAPTGRAAFRMRESVTAGLAHIAKTAPTDDELRAASIDAATVHRMLGYSPERGTFRHHCNNPLAARVVIVDEGSMLDLALMEHLVGALGPDSQLIILGDADQLPSVAAGAAFRDLLPTGSGDPLSEASVRLTRNYRTLTATPAGAAIVEAAERINRGESERQSASASAGEIAFEGVEMLAADELEALLDRWEHAHIIGDAAIAALANREYKTAGGMLAQEERAQLARLFSHLTRSRILCVTRVGSTGSELINARLHRRTIRRTPAASARQPIVAGEPVMMLRNDYERGLFNGDQGVAVNSRDAEGRRWLAVAFQRGEDFVAFRLDTIRDSIELCYATTVHKAQGSEFDTAAVILPERDLPLLTRELLYTAVSRCRRSVIILGDPQTLTAGIERKAERYSGLAAQLAARLKPSAPRQLTLDF